jgi:hypothetical protein
MKDFKSITYKNFKKNQPIRISHHGPKSLDIVGIFTTVGNFHKVVDYYTATCIDYILENSLLKTKTERAGVCLQVDLVEF